MDNEIVKMNQRTWLRQSWNIARKRGAFEGRFRATGFVYTDGEERFMIAL